MCDWAYVFYMMMLFFCGLWFSYSGLWEQSLKTEWHEVAITSVVYFKLVSYFIWIVFDSNLVNITDHLLSEYEYLKFRFGDSCYCLSS